MNIVNATDTTMEYHAHTLLEWIALNEGQLYKTAIRQGVEEQFGKDARFYTCAASGLSLEELLVFLQDKEKVHLRDGRYWVNPANICSQLF